jgi:hypothetical protein
LFLHGLGDTADGWILPMRKLRLKYPHIRFVILTAPKMKITANKGAEAHAWHDIIKGLEMIDEEKCEGLENSRRMGIIIYLQKVKFIL